MTANRQPPTDSREDNMRLEWLSILRCPFCGSRLAFSDRAPRGGGEAEAVWGILGCDCCAYPVVAGIPYLQANRLAQSVLQRLDQGDQAGAFQLLSGLAEERRAEAASLVQGEGGWTFRRALSLFCPGPEADYFLYRGSDPTFVVGEGVVSALAGAWPLPGGRVLDVCGGTGHLVRALGVLQDRAEIVVSDRDFWKVWLARRFVAPRSLAVCCDAAQSLPFARGSFDWVICSDGLNYIWPRRLLVGEMNRLAADSGMVLVLHMHNATADNPSEGMPLKPETFRGLFETRPVRLFPESRLLDSLLGQRAIDLGRSWEDAALVGEPAFCAVATKQDFIFRSHEAVPVPCRPERLRLNPLYRAEPEGKWLVCRREFPSHFYESEYAAGKRYLPETIRLEAEELARLKAGDMSGSIMEWAAKRVLLDLPPDYV